MKLKHEGRTYRLMRQTKEQREDNPCSGCAFNINDGERYVCPPNNGCVDTYPPAEFIWRETFLSRLVRAYREELAANDHAVDRYGQP